MTGSRPAYRAFLSRHFTPGRVYTLVGAGGKSTGMRRIAESLAGRGIRARLTTTTKIGIDEFSAYPVTIVNDSTELALSMGGAAPFMVIVGGTLRERGRYTGLESSLIERVIVPADAVLLVEGDGSRRKPMKVPTSGEPVIPDSTDVVFALMGASAFDEPIDAERCCNPEGALALLGRSEGVFDAQALVSLAADPRGCRKGVRSGMGYHLIVNQGDVDAKRDTALALLRQLEDVHGIAGTLLSWREEKVYAATGR
jgi:probable selenium-dependent hydroxylase accessory protein YqeC